MRLLAQKFNVDQWSDGMLSTIIRRLRERIYSFNESRSEGIWQSEDFCWEQS